MPNNISRIDVPDRGQHGYQVRVWYGGDEFSKYFADSLHGGKTKARQAAIAYRAKLLDWRAAQPPVPRVYTERFYYPNARNATTGVVGVWRVLKRSANGRPPTPYYQTSSSPEKGLWVSRAFNAHRLGEAPAFLAACLLRKAYLTYIYPERFSPNKFDNSVLRRYVKIYTSQELPVDMDLFRSAYLNVTPEVDIDLEGL